MDELHQWVKYWRKSFSKCSRIHKDSKVFRQAYAELSGYLDKLEDAAQREALDAAVLWAVTFTQRLYELEKTIGLHVPEKKVPSVRLHDEHD